MSKAKVEVVRQALNTWIEVDEGLADVDELREFFTPEAVLQTRDLPESFGESSVEWHGINEFIEWRATWIESFDDWSYSAEKILDAGGNRVMGMFEQRGRLHGGDSWVHMHYAIVYTVEEGLINAGRLYMNRDEALEAVGLSE